MNIEVRFDNETCTYTILCNGEIIFECLGFDEVLDTRISEIYRFCKDEV